MSSRSGRRSRGRAQHWDPAAVRASRVPRLEAPAEKRVESDDPEKVAYWKARYDDKVERAGRRARSDPMAAIRSLIRSGLLNQKKPPTI